MGKNKGVTDVINKVRKRIEMEEAWANHLGNIPSNFRMLVKGKPKNGKTSYALQLSKMFAQKWGKVYYNSVEEGDTASMAEALARFNMSDVKGKWILAREDDANFDKMIQNLSRPNSGRVIIIDSLDYMRLTLEQYKVLSAKFKHKAIVIICWSDPMDADAKRIEYNCNIIVEVKDYIANVRSRFGGNEPFTIWERPSVTKPNPQLTLFQIQKQA